MDRIFEPFFTTKPRRRRHRSRPVRHAGHRAAARRPDHRSRIARSEEGGGARFTVVASRSTVPSRCAGERSTPIDPRRSVGRGPPIDDAVLAARADHRRRAVDSRCAATLLHATRLAGGRSERRRRGTRDAAGGEDRVRGRHLRPQDAGLSPASSFTITSPPSRPSCSIESSSRPATSRRRMPRSSCSERGARCCRSRSSSARSRRIVSRMRQMTPA